jgi:hypothetical protein
MLVVAALPLLVACGGGPSGPNPSPTPFPRAKANATAFENVAFVRGFEEASGRRSLLVNITAFGILPSGAPIADGGAWFYIFSDPRDLKLYNWQVYSDGRVLLYPDVPDIAHHVRAELFPETTIDSPRAWTLALSYGAKPYLDRYPNAHAAMNCAFRAGIPTWQVRFFDEFARPRPCELGPIYIDARTGELLSADLYCLTRLP